LLKRTQYASRTLWQTRVQDSQLSNQRRIANSHLNKTRKAAQTIKPLS